MLPQAAENAEDDLGEQVGDQENELEMRILQVIHGFLPQFRGGTELYLLGLARELRDQGHRIHIVTGTTHVAAEPHVEAYDFDGFPISKIVLSGGYLEHWTRSFSPEATRLFAETVQELQPDIVHIQHWFRLSRSLVETCHRLGVPVVCTLHDLWTTCPRIFRIRDESFCERPLSAESCTTCVPRFPFMDDAGVAEEVDLFRADFANELQLARRIIVPSRAHADVVADCATLPEERVIVLPHGTIVPERDDRERTRQPHGADHGRKRTVSKRAPIRLGVWGHLFHMKGVHLVLEALAQLGKKSRRFELNVWGKVIEPRYKKRLEELSEGLEVNWLGAFEPADIAAVALDCAVIPSLCSESYSFVLDEAFDLGLPAIVSDRGALAERIGEAGAVFEAENAQSLAALLSRLADEPERLLRWRQAIPELNTMARHAQTMAQVYAAVLAEPRPQDLRPDPGLPWRRLEQQTRSVRRYEEVMFGQIGHIKREMGRGDHYEGEMRKLLHEKETWAEERSRMSGDLTVLNEREAHESKIISVLAAEIENFRQALQAYLKGDLGFTPTRPEFAEFPEHVPGLGPITLVVEQDHELLQSYGYELAKRRKSRQAKRDDLETELLRKDEVLKVLGDEIKAFRDFLALIGAAKPAFKRQCPPPPEFSAAVPDLGPVAAVLRENHELMVDHFAILKRQLAIVTDCEARIAAAETAAHGSSELVASQGAEFADVQAKTKALELQLDTVTRQAKALQKEKADLESRLALKEARLLSRSVEDQVSVAEAQKLKASLKLTTASSEAAQREALELRGALEESRASEQDLQRELVVLRAAEQTLTARVEALSGERARLLELEQEAEALRQDVGELAALEGRLQRQEELGQFLAALIEDLRRGISAVYQDELTFVPKALVGAETVAAHVPGLGDLATIARINAELIDGLLTEVRNLRAAQSPSNSD